MKVNIYCMTIKHYRLIDKLPKNIIPFGLGKNNFPSNWLNEKEGDSIIDLNKFFGEATGIYWIWKNLMNNYDKKSLIGFCQYRRLWLNGLFDKKQKNNLSSLYSNLLRNNNELLNSSESILLQPTVFKNINLIQDFDNLYGKNILEDCSNLINEKDRYEFKQFLKGNKFSICNMFITKPEIFDQYCNEMFDWINKCFIYCKNKNLLNNNNMRLPIFMVERFTAFWFQKYSKCNYLSFARLGNLILSNSLNKLINPLKIPGTFRMYPTIHRY